MKRGYKKPGIVEYSREEILEMLGPVKTQYVEPECLSCSEAQMRPSAILQGKVLRVSFSVRTTACPRYQRIRVSVPGSSPFIYYEFNKSDGVVSGDRWSVNVDDFQYLGERGNYDVLITLIDSQGNQGSPCSTTLTIE